MTKQEILDSLEGLKDYVNDTGKRSIDGIKAAVSTLQESPPVQVTEPREEEVKLVKIEKHEVKKVSPEPKKAVRKNKR